MRPVAFFFALLPAMLGAPSCATAQGFAPSQNPFNWNGIYVGLQGGLSQSTVKAESGPFGADPNQFYAYSPVGYAVGPHIGFNIQAGKVVLGGEADVDFSDYSSSSIGTGGYIRQTHISWLSTVRARAGLVADALLFYGTAGLAVSGGNTATSLPGVGVPFVTSDERYFGWTYGAGVEFAFSSRSTMRLEFRRVDLGSSSYANAAANVHEKSDITTNQLRIGLGLKF